MQVFLSAGHSNTDPGAVANGVREADLALELRDALAKALRDGGLTVATDGTPGFNQPLREAVQTAKSNKQGLNIEFHFNAGPPSAAGVEVLAREKHKRVAQALAQAISRVTRSPLRGDAGWKPENAGQHHRLAFVQAGGMIVEVCFITNTEDLAAYQRSFGAVVQSLAQAVTGIASATQASRQNVGQIVQAVSHPLPVISQPQPAPIPQVTSIAAPALRTTTTTTINQAAPVTVSKWNTLGAFRVVQLLTGGTLVNAAFWQEYKWPLIALGLFFLGAVFMWQFQPPREKKTL